MWGCGEIHKILVFVFFLTSFFPPSLKASCSDYLFIDHEFRALVKIADKNKKRREAVMRSKKEEREALVKEHLFAAVRYEQEKINIYISMLDKILKRNWPYSTTAHEIKKRLLKSIASFNHIQISLVEAYGTDPVPLQLIMSPEVSRFIYSNEAL